MHLEPSAQLFEQAVHHKHQRLKQFDGEFQVHAFCKLQRKVFWQQWSRVGPARNELQAPAFLSNPLDHGDFGESRKLRASMNAPARQGIQQLPGDLERGERKGTDTCGFVSCWNNRNARKSTCRANCGFRGRGNRNVGVESHFRRSALQLGGITLASRDPQGGHIDRNQTGEPTGILRETAQAALLAVVPKPAHQQRRQ